MALKSKALVKLNDSFKALSKREQVIILLALFLIPVYLFAELFFLPAQKEKRQLTAQYQTTQQSVAETTLQLIELEAALSDDPDQAQRQRHTVLQEQIASFDQSLQNNLSGLVPAPQMATLLRVMLSEHTGLTLISLKNRIPQSLVVEEVAAQGGDGESSEEEEQALQPNAPVLYQHGIELQLSGSYLDMLNYLRQLQSLPQRLFWQSVDIEMSDHYPRAHVVLNVYTLSFQEGWIGG